MQAPLLTNLGTIAQTLPLAAALFGRASRGPRRWVLAWTGIELLETALSYLMASRGVHNLWLVYVLAPVDGAVALWALSLWQTGPVARLTFRLSIPAAVVVFYVLAAVFDSASSFSRAALPMMQLVCLGAAAYTLVARSFVARGDLLDEDWFWICGGMVLYFGTFSAVGPLSLLLVRRSPALVVRAIEAASVLMTVAFLAIARGVACPVET